MVVPLLVNVFYLIFEHVFPILVLVKKQLIVVILVVNLFVRIPGARVKNNALLLGKIVQM